MPTINYRCKKPTDKSVGVGGGEAHSLPIYLGCDCFQDKNPTLFSRVKDEPKCSLAMKYAFFSLGERVSRYFSARERTSRGSGDGERTFS